jgi:hypothetical protein
MLGYYPYLITLVVAIVSINVFTDNGFHRWHGSHLTPHILGVSLNLREANLLCNYLEPSCQTYHRHPPLYFYLNYFISLFSKSSSQYQNLAMSMSMIFNYVGVALFMRALGNKNHQRLFILLFFTSTYSFLVHQTLSSYDSMFLLICGLMTFSIKEDSKIIGYTAIFLSTLLSWYLVLFSIVFVSMQLYKKDFKALIPFAFGLFITFLFLINGFEFIVDNIKEASKNIDFSDNINKDRIYDFNTTIRHVIANFFKVIAPILFLQFLILSPKTKSLFKSIIAVPMYGYASLLTFFIWNMIFFRWSLIHDFIYIGIVPYLLMISLAMYEMLDKKFQILAIILSAIITINYGYEIRNFYLPIEKFDNEGVEIYLDAIKGHGFNYN